MPLFCWQDEYFYYDSPDNGDIHEVVQGKFFAFLGEADMLLTLVSPFT